jgi:hypothetical protein
MFGFNHFSSTSLTVIGFYNVQTVNDIAVSGKSFVAVRNPVILLSISPTQKMMLS